MKNIEAEDLMEEIAAYENLESAWCKVKEKGGQAGGDTVSIKAFEIDLTPHLKRIARELRTNQYRPLSIRCYQMQKSNGKTRLIGIPSVQDRVVQRGFLNILGPFYESRFRSCSFGYRPGKNVDMAIRKVVDFYDQGFHWIADADIEAFFDRIPHSPLRKLLASDIRDKRVCRVLNLWMAMSPEPAPEGKEKCGILQGNVISPLMANVYLHQFDEAVLSPERRLVRYGDDFLILCRTRRQAEKALQDSRLILERLQLRLNEEKTRIVHFHEGVTFLGKTLLPRSGVQKEPSAAPASGEASVTYWIYRI